MAKLHSLHFGGRCPSGIATRAGALAVALTLTVALGIASAPALAGVFAAVASPPRFELAGKAGETVRAVVEVSNSDVQPGTYQLRTSDWTLSPEGGPSFQEELAPGSCRPWVALERRQVTLQPQAARSLRFEIQIPAGTPDGECRFALMVEQDEANLSKVMAGNLPVPVQGRIAVIIYVRVGDAKPRLKLLDVKLKDIAGKPTPVARVINEGNAHDRLDGIVTATDQDQKAINFVITQLPILPGETRELPFSVYAESDYQPKSAPVVWKSLLKIKGTIESENGQKIMLDMPLQP